MYPFVTPIFMPQTAFYSFIYFERLSFPGKQLHITQLRTEISVLIVMTVSCGVHYFHCLYGFPTDLMNFVKDTVR